MSLAIILFLSHLLRRPQEVQIHIPIRIPRLALGPHMVVFDCSKNLTKGDTRVG